MKYAWIIAFLSIAALGNTQITITVNGLNGFPCSLVKLNNALVPIYDTIHTDTISLNQAIIIDERIEAQEIFYFSVANKLIPLPLESDVEYNISIQSPQVEAAAFSKLKILEFEANGNKQHYFHESVSAFNKSLSKFFAENPAIRKDSNGLSKLEELRQQQLTIHKKELSSNSYFQNYFKNRFAIFCYSIGNTDVYLKKLDFKSISYNSSSQLKALRLRFNTELSSWEFEFNEKLREWGAQDSSLHNLLLSLNKNIEGVTKDQIEILLFQSVYKNKLPGYSIDKRLLLLKELGDFSSNVQIQNACEAGYNKLSKLLPNSEAPSFSFSDNKGRTISLESLKGRFVYLQFWNQKNTASLLDMKLIDKIKKTYGKKIAFVSVHCNGSKDDFLQYMSSHPYKWPIFHVEPADAILSNYQVETTPLYFLIDPQGYLFRSPAERPNRMYQTFDKILDSEISGVNVHEIIRTYDEE